ncbi:MAG: hypothetical protein JW818_17180 [Pirellulales bacterium]|nr:hypothetical protein [Pirellulales bacterium]
MPASSVVISPEHHVPADKNLSPEWIASLTAKDHRKIFRSKELFTIGMPCGGVCAGQLYVRGDGTLARWWIANNAYITGVWWPPYEDPRKDYSMQTPLGPCQSAYRTYRPESYVEQRFALRVVSGDGKAVVATLDHDGFDDIGFIGEYPIATILYERKQKVPLPVAVRAEVFSPFIPLNCRDSAMPVTVLRYELTNRSEEPIDVSLVGWLQNAVCLELADRVRGESRNVVIRHGGLTSVEMDFLPEPVSSTEPRRTRILADFEKGTYAGWSVEGDAFSDAPATGTLPNQQKLGAWEGKYFVNSYRGGNDRLQGCLISEEFTITEPFMTFRIGGGDHPGRTCVNLVIDGRIVRTATGTRNVNLSSDCWHVGPWIGKKAHVEIVDRESGPWGHITFDHMCLTNMPPKMPLLREHPQFGNMALTAMDRGATAVAAWKSKNAMLDELVAHASPRGPDMARKPLGTKCIGTVCTPLHLEPGQRRAATFLVTWYFPNRRQGNVGPIWGTHAGIGQRVGNMYANWFNSSLDVARYVAENSDRLYRETRLFRDTYYDTTLPYWLAQRISMQVSTLATETCQWWANGRFWAFEGVGCCHGTCNHVWHYEQAMARLFPTLQRSWLEMQTFNPQTGFDAATGMIRYRGEGLDVWAADGQSGNILMALREHQLSPDDQFLKRNWPAVRKAIEFLIEQDKQDGNEDGILEGPQHNTYDINFYGANSMIGSLYHASLLAGEKMAVTVEDPRFAARCRHLADSGRRLTVERLFNGEYFIQDVDLQKHPHDQFGKGCLSDQMIGQTWAHSLGLGYLYPEKYVHSALRAVWKYNWAPDVGPQIKAHRPEIHYANPGEAGLLLCTWPTSPHPGPQSVRYRNTVWTGIEFQVAANMIYEGMITEGLGIVRGVHERYDAVKHNPWNLILCGDHYSRAMASWGCLLAVSGFTYDGPAGELGFAPRLSPEHFRAFFSGTEGWGTLHQHRESDQQINQIELAWGKLRLNSLRFDLPENMTPAEDILVTVAGHKVPASSRLHNRHLTITLQRSAVLTARESLTVTIPLTPHGSTRSLGTK